MQVSELSCRITGILEKSVLSRSLILVFFFKPKVRTGISKPYNVKQIKTTTAEEAEEAIRCLMEAKGGEHRNLYLKKTAGVFIHSIIAQKHILLFRNSPEH